MKTKKNALLVLFALILTGLISCNHGFDDCTNTIYIKNNSAKSIYAVSTLKKDFFNFNPTNENYKDDFMIEPGETIKVKIGIKLQCWEQTLEQTGGHVYIYVYDAEYLENPDVRWEDAQKNHIKLYTLNVNDLRDMNWEVKYP